MDTSHEQVVDPVLYSESNVSASLRFRTRRANFVLGSQGLGRALVVPPQGPSVACLPDAHKSAPRIT